MRAAVVVAVLAAVAVVLGLTLRDQGHGTGSSGSRSSRPASAAASSLPPSPSSSPAAPPVSSPTAPVPMPPPLQWRPCENGHTCATLSVPLDYAVPTGAHIGVALERRTATGTRIGSLVINPGGPGESGILNFAKDLGLLPAGVLSRFDVVTFDPRGVGQSDPVHCASTPPTHVDPIPTTATGAAALQAADAAYANACLQTAGAALLAHVGTVDTAHDLESIRLAVGDSGLTYLGLSYGTLLGATYAELFPTHVRAMVLDGAIDPSLSLADLANAQAAGFQAALNAFFTWCASAPTCAWRPAGDPHAAFEALVAKVRATPLGSGDKVLGVGEFYTGTYGTLYAHSFWPSLGRALAGVAAGDGTAMRSLYDAYERAGDPSFNGDANNAITCLDHPAPRDVATYFGRAHAAAGAAPDFGPLFAWGALSCGVWPTPDSAARPVGPVHAPGSPPILVVGTTEDPATPYAWAIALAHQLDHGVLLTRVGQDHVALFYSSCVRSYDESYLVNLALPPNRTACR